MKEIKSIFTILAIAGNIFFILWILYNGFNENFEGTIVEKFSYIVLMLLLVTNSLLLIAGKKRKQIKIFDK